MTLEVDRQARESAAWNTVWGDRLASLADTDPSVHLVESWWISELGSLGRIGRFVEIGCGGAASVSRIMVRHFAGAEVIASDFRKVSPAFPGATFIGDAPIEALPFEENSVDVVASQFAFEYARRDAAIAEVSRVLRPGGAARMLLHHAGSLFSRRLVHRVRVLGIGVALSEALAMDLRTSQRRQRLNRLLREMQALRLRYSRPPVDADALGDIDDFIELARRSVDEEREAVADTGVKQLQQCAPALLLARLQMKACCAIEAMDGIVRQFQLNGFDVATHVLVDGQARPIAWGLRLQRAG